MTYQTGGLIQTSDYNGFINNNASANINAIWNTAYGQNALTAVATGDIISASKWAALFNTVNSIANHQGTTVASRINPASGSLIQALTNVGTDITNCTSNILNAATSGTPYSAWTGTTSKTAATGSGTSSWSITFTSTITFNSASAASNFFNAGGLIKLQFSKTSTGTTADTSWNSFIGSSGSPTGVVANAVFFSSAGAIKTIAGTQYTGTTTQGGTGTPATLARSVGYAQLTASPQTIYQQLDPAAPYTGYYVKVTAQSTGTTLTFVTTWFSTGGVISGGSATSASTFGTAPTTLVTYIPPETTYLSNTWGTPTITSSVA